jgi:hypothetical protein
MTEIKPFTRERNKPKDILASAEAFPLITYHIVEIAQLISTKLSDYIVHCGEVQQLSGLETRILSSSSTNTTGLRKKLQSLTEGEANRLLKLIEYPRFLLRFVNHSNDPRLVNTYHSAAQYNLFKAIDTTKIPQLIQAEYIKIIGDIIAVNPLFVCINSSDQPESTRIDIPFRTYTHESEKLLRCAPATIDTEVDPAEGMIYTSITIPVESMIYKKAVIHRTPNTQCKPEGALCLYMCLKYDAETSTILTTNLSYSPGVQSLIAEKALHVSNS